jgi:hypothetical protein
VSDMREFTGAIAGREKQLQVEARGSSCRWRVAFAGRDGGGQSQVRGQMDGLASRWSGAMDGGKQLQGMEQFQINDELKR